jgi:predicted permease
MPGLPDWFRSLVSRRSADDDLGDELQFHLEHEQAKLERQGLDAAEARRLASVRFGGRSGVVEECREGRRLAWLEDLAKDTAYAWRSLRRTPLFTCAVIGSLVLGIGVNVTVITLMRAALWRSLPGVAQPERIAHLVGMNAAQPSRGEFSLSYVLFQQLQETAGSTAQVVAKRTSARHKFGLDPESRERVTGEAVSGNFFTVLGVNASAGRVLVAADDRIGGARVAVVSHRFWSLRFQADPSLIGRTIYYDESPFLIVGVAASGFDGVDAETPVDLWIPLTADPQVTPAWFSRPGVIWLTLLARLAPGSSFAAVEARLDQRFRTHLETELLPGVPERFRGPLLGQHLHVRPAAAGLATTGRRYQSQLQVLLGIAVCSLLICCANVANLVRARTERRRQEFDLRRMLGARGSRLLRQVTTEGLLLAALGASGGLLLAPWWGQLLLRMLPNRPITFDLTPDAPTIAVTAFLGVATALVAIAWPAWRLGSRPRYSDSGSRVSRRLIGGKVIVVSQLAAVMVLLVIAGLSIAMFRRLNAISLGFDPTSVLSVELSFPKTTPENRASDTFERLRRTLQQAGAIEAVTYAYPSVYDTGGTSLSVLPDGYVAVPGEDTEAGVIVAGPGFFDVLRIPLQQGRAFGVSDVSRSTRAAIVNEAFVKRYFPDRVALGRYLRMPGPQPELREIVGVVADVRHYGVTSSPWSLKADQWPMVYMPGTRPDARLLMRVRDGSAAQALVRSAVSSEAAARVETIRPLRDAVVALIGREQMLARLSGIVAALALALAALGLYGVVAYGVMCRRAEFGIRLALGATPIHIRRLVLGETMTLVGVGIGLGLLLSLPASRAMAAFIAESPGVDPRTAGIATLCLAAIALIAGWFPAWRASRTDPAVTLRAE